jgi:phage minor structural protein
MERGSSRPANHTKVVLLVIPILYTAGAMDWSNNGLGFLRDCVDCKVTEERNGIYELEMKYPLSGAHYEEIAENCLIKAKTNETADLQLFRVYKSSKPINGIVTYNAQHISYDLNGIVVPGLAVNDATAQEAMTQALEQAITAHGFTAWSNIEAATSTTVPEPCSIRAALGGQRGSILDAFGGEYEFDNLEAKLHKERGADNGVRIEYAKNLTGITATTSTESTYTGLYPYAVLEEGLNVSLPEMVIQVPHIEGMQERVLTRDFSQELSEKSITTDALRAIAQSWLATNDIGTPNISVTVNFINLSKTTEYAQYTNLERVALCDVVTVRHKRLGVDITAKVVKTKYDTLAEQYAEITIGSVKSNMAATIAKMKDEIKAIGRTTTTTIAQLENSIMLAVATQYVSGDYLATYIKQLSDSITLQFFSTIDELRDAFDGNKSLLEQYIRFKGALMELGRSDSAFTAEISNEKISFKENGSEIAYISGHRLIITDAQVLTFLRIGDKWIQYQDDNGDFVIGMLGGG